MIKKNADDMRKRDIERDESSFHHLSSTDRSGKRSSHCRATMEFGSQNPNPRNCQSLDLQCEREKMLRRIKTREKEIGKASSRREREGFISNQKGIENR